MIDTMYISYKLTKVEYNQLFTSINELSIKLNGAKLHNDRNDKNACVTYALKEKGVTELKLRKVNKFVEYRAIEIKLRPKLLSEENNYYDLTSLNEFELVRKGFNRVMLELSTSILPDFIYWNVKRIDYAMDLSVQQELIPIYMLLFKKANLPIYTLDSPITKKYIESNTNLYLYSTNVTINFYDRYNTLINKQAEKGKNWTNIERVKNTLRLEIQCKNCKGQVFEYISINRYKKVLDNFYDLIIGNGDYFLLTDSLKIIDRNIKNIRKCMEMRKFMRQIESSGGIWKAKDLCVQGLNGKDRKDVLYQFSSILNKIRKIGINPVSLPEDLGIDKLKNLKEQINQEILVIQAGISKSKLD